MALKLNKGLSSEKGNELDCFTMLEQMTNYFISNSDSILKMYRNSGKDYNDFGRMDDCEAIDGFNYLLMTFSTDEKLPIPFNMGLCVPTICKEADLNEFLPIFLPVMN